VKDAWPAQPKVVPRIGRNHLCSEAVFRNCTGAGWPWAVTHPGLPQTRTCGHYRIRFLGRRIRRPLWSPKLSGRVTVTCESGLDVPDMFPSTESADRRFASLHWVLQGEFPSFRGTIKTLRLPVAHLAALRFLRLAIPRIHSLVSLPHGRVHRRGLELITRYPQPGLFEETTGSPKFLGNPHVPFAMFPSDSGRTLAPDHFSASAWPPV
jgi:hypothetical protein